MNEIFKKIDEDSYEIIYYIRKGYKDKLYLDKIYVGYSKYNESIIINKEIIEDLREFLSIKDFTYKCPYCGTDPKKEEELIEVKPSGKEVST